MKKKIKWLAILVIICLLLLTIFVIFICHGKKDQNKKNQQEGFSLEEVIKNPEYSLDELYDIIEEPEKFYELTAPVKSSYAIEMYYFYNYFSKNTPVKVAKKVKTNDSKVVEVVEVEYINKDEFEKRMESAYQSEEVLKNSTEESNKTNNDEYDYREYIPYNKFIRELIYGYAEEMEG